MSKEKISKNSDQVLVEIEHRDFTRFLERVRSLVSASRMNYSQLSKAIDCPPNLFYRYENGSRTPDLKILVAVSNYFDVSVDWLLGIDQYEESQQDMINLYEKAIPEDKKVIDTILQKYGES